VGSPPAPSVPVTRREDVGGSRACGTTSVRGAPWRRGAVWLQQRHAGLANQPVLHVAPGGRGCLPPDEGWRVLLDPNELSEDGTTR
jgi:hypothetical protein